MESTRVLTSTDCSTLLTLIRHSSFQENTMMNSGRTLTRDTAICGRVTINSCQIAPAIPVNISHWTGF
ncbi:hypothetical protein ANCCAN_09204 [Ancylostoma caninum]|uniref:Uncharacterized protein n=1 Tax=Ancylostoma caninum TaxID=29170 RepID=A0A368GP52_ANCCA|nr:hypothetical protein ANCCAN_09204 [Ancylostoma caninum]